jgi:hypothetical protein
VAGRRGRGSRRARHQRSNNRNPQKLRSEGRAPGTINKLVRKYLSGPFEKARKLGKIKFTPVMVTDPEKVESVARHTFTPEQVARLVAVANRDWNVAILLA